VAVGWADQRFAHWFASGPAPVKPPAHGWPGIRYELFLWFRCAALPGWFTGALWIRGRFSRQWSRLPAGYRAP
jgi:hypothetical protein